MKWIYGINFGAKLKKMLRKFVYRKWSHFEFDDVEIIHGISLPQTAHFIL